MLTYLLRNVEDEPMITPAFDDKWIDNMLIGACDIDEDIKHIYIGVDPAGGKTKNLYAVCSMVVTNDGNCIVCNIRLFIYFVCASEPVA